MCVFVLMNIMEVLTNDYTVPRQQQCTHTSLWRLQFDVVTQFVLMKAYLYGYFLLYIRGADYEVAVIVKNSSEVITMKVGVIILIVLVVGLKGRFFS